MSTAALFTTVERWEQPRCRPQVINERHSICTMERDSAVTRNDALTHTATWMGLGDIILSERSQTQKATYV